MLPRIAKRELNYVWPINWLGLHRAYLNPGEMEILAALLREIEAKSVIEFGCRDGRTARVLLQNVTALNCYVGVDVPMSYEPELKHQRHEMVSDPGHLATADPRFDLIMRPRGTLELEPMDFAFYGAISAVFIDGDHSERVVTHDAHLARALVKPGGMIIFHDYASEHLSDVTRALDALHDKGWPLVHVEDSWLAFCRIGEASHADRRSAA